MNHNGSFNTDCEKILNGRPLRLKRKQIKGLYQREVADAAGISIGTLVDFENGHAGPDRATYERIYRALDRLIAERKGVKEDAQTR